MKHLKKLSVVLMLTTLFSVTFTSCIDNEVSPIVEAIYEAQADLIAAQAGVQNAEAAYLLAQAEAEQATAAWRTAQAAQVAAYTAGIVADNAYTAAQRVQYLLELVAETNLNVANLQNDLELAQVNFEIQLAAAIATMEAAGVQLAVGYAWDYAYAMQHANVLMSELLSAQADLASAQLMQTTIGTDDVSWEYALAKLQGAVTNSIASKANLEDAIAEMEAYIANPSTPEAVLSGLRAQKLAYAADLAAKTIEIAAQQNKINALYDQVSVRGALDGRVDAALLDHNTAVTTKNGLVDDIEELEEEVSDLAAALASYDADLAAAKTAVTTTTAAYTAAWTALGEKDSQGASLKSLFGTYFTKSGKTASPENIVYGATKYAAPANLQQVYVNARIDVLDATKDYNDYNDDFLALVSTYNTAAANLAAAKAAFDGSTYASDLATANTNYTTALGVKTTAQSAYAAAKTAFEANPAGFDVTDAPAAINKVDDLGSIGITGDAFGTTYREVTGWVKNVGSSVWTPSSFGPVKTQAQTLIDIDAKIAGYATTRAIPGGAVGGEYNMVDRTDFYLWQQDGTRGSFNVAGALVNTADPATYGASDTEVPYLVSVSSNTDIEAIIYLEVEADDVPVSKLFKFNIATNKLGTNSFSDRAFTTNAPGTTFNPITDWETALTFSDADAGYDVSWNGDLLVPQVNDALTAQAALWNMALELAKKQYAFDNGSAGLDAAQAAYDYQKELFDNGVANLAVLDADKTAATTAQTAAKKAVDNAWTALGVEYAPAVYDALPKYWTADATHTAAKYDIDGTSGYDIDFAGSGTAKALTVNAVVYNAEIVKADLVEYDDEYLEGEIATINTSIVTKTLQVANIQPIIDAKYAVVAGLLGELTAAGVTFTFEVGEDGLGVLTITNAGAITIGTYSTYSDIHAELIAEYQALWALNQEKTAISEASGLNDLLITAYGSAKDLSNLKATLGTLKTDLGIAILNIEKAEQALATAQVQEDAAAAMLAYYEALIDTLEARHANTLAIAAKYKALMEAALAS